MGTRPRCLCGGLSVGTQVSGLDIAALDAEIAALAKTDSKVTARRSQVIAELNRRRSDAAERLRNSGGMSSRDANKASKTADGLEKLPKTREALEAGEISPGQAEQLASRMDKPELAKRVANNEAELLERAKNENTDEFARTMRKDDIAGSPDDGNTTAQRQHRARMAHMWIDPETGLHHLFAKFDPVSGARISTQLQAMVDKMWRAEHRTGHIRNQRQADQRRADALTTLVCRGNIVAKSTSTESTSSAAGSGSSGEGSAPGTPSNAGATAEGTETEQQGFNFAATNDSANDQATKAPGPTNCDDPADAPVPPPANPTQLLVIASFDALRQTLGGGTLADGTPLPADTVAKLACDADILPAIFDTNGQPLWLGRTQRLATPTQRVAVTARDHGCIVCHASSEYCQVHHINWWSNGGKTDLNNLCLLCSRHHTMVHERGLTVEMTRDGMKVQPQPSRAVRSVPDPPPGPSTEAPASGTAARGRPQVPPREPRTRRQARRGAKPDVAA